MYYLLSEWMIYWFLYLSKTEHMFFFKLMECVQKLITYFATEEITITYPKCK